MNTKQIDRRVFSRTVVPAVVVGASMTAAGCSTTGSGLDPALVVQIIAGVQQKVADACKALGDFVPTAKSILDMIGALTGQVAVAQAIISIADEIIGVACPPAQSAQPVPAGQRTRAPGSVKVKTVTVEFIRL